MRQMTEEETSAFLLEGTRTGKLAWVSKDGRPQVTPVWFVLDGHDVIFNTHETAGKAKALKREGRASFVVDDQAPPYSFVKIDGSISFEDDLETVRATATKIGARYMGADRAENLGTATGPTASLSYAYRPIASQRWLT